MIFPEKIKYIFISRSFRTKEIVPKCSTYMDERYTSNVHKKFRKVKITTFSNLTLLSFISLLNYMD